MDRMFNQPFVILISLGLMYISCDSDRRFVIKAEYVAPKSTLHVFAKSEGIVKPPADLGRGNLHAIFSFDTTLIVNLSMQNCSINSIECNGDSISIISSSPSASIIPFLYEKEYIEFDRRELLILDTLVYGICGGPKSTAIRENVGGVQIVQVTICDIIGQDTFCTIYPLKNEHREFSY